MVASDTKDTADKHKQCLGKGKLWFQTEADYYYVLLIQ